MDAQWYASRTGSRHFFLFLGLGFPYNLLKPKEGTLCITRLLPGLASFSVFVAQIPL